MLDTMKALVKEKDICVLATVSGDKPYCSLMAYLCNDPCTEIYMVTYGNSQKYRNLTRNPAVSILIDTRDQGMVPDRGVVKALTITGRYEAMTDPEKKEAIRKNMMKHHAHLHEIIQHEDGEIIVIKISSFLFLDGPTKAHFEEINETRCIP
jgi:nitroimidazol reductase NimA-like FMN-containing flavoprotein (pyridoxamine 5'-phosphate oxidase superfamily)